MRAVCLFLALATLPLPVRAQTSAPPALAAASQDLPNTLIGTYAAASEGCVGAASVMQVTPRSVVIMSSSGENRLVRAVTTGSVGDWTVAVGMGDEMPRVLLRRAGEGAQAGIDRLLPNPKLRDDQLPGPQAADHFVRCDELPPALALLHGEGLTMLRGLEAAEPPCTTGLMQECAEAFMSYADLNKDGRLNVAEVARVIRGAVWFAQMSAGTTAGELEAGLAASLPGGVAASEFVIRSYDYDGQGSITLQQLMRDRLSTGLQPRPRSKSAPPLDIGPIGPGVPQLGPLMAILRLLG